MSVLSVQQALTETVEQWKDCPLELIDEVLGDFFIIRKIEFKDVELRNIAPKKTCRVGDLLKSDEIDLAEPKAKPIRDILDYTISPRDIGTLEVYDFGEFYVTVFNACPCDVYLGIKTPWGALNACNCGLRVEIKHELTGRFKDFDNNARSTYFPYLKDGKLAEKGIETEKFTISPTGIEYLYERFIEKDDIDTEFLVGENIK
jgi:hypothetical protein